MMGSHRGLVVRDTEIGQCRRTPNLQPDLAPRQGCWRVTGTIAGQSLTFIAWIHAIEWDIAPLWKGKQQAVTAFGSGLSLSSGTRPTEPIDNQRTSW